MADPRKGERKRAMKAMQSVLMILALLAGTVLMVGCPQAPKTVQVPALDGLTLEAAQAALEAVGLKSGTVTTQEVTGTAADAALDGTVMAQAPKASLSVNIGSLIDLVLRKVKVDVPNVLGKTENAARVNLLLFTVQVAAPEYSDTVAAGLVLRQNPAAGTRLGLAGVVALTLSKGQEPVLPVSVPNVVGSAQGAAETAITAAKLTLGSVTQAYSTTVPAGLVISQNPAAGASVAPGTAVALVVSKGAELVAVPSVIGQLQANATAAITAGRLTILVTEAYSDTVAAGLVISQNPTAGTTVAPGGIQE